MSTPIETIFNGVQWEVVPPPEHNPEGLPFPTHSGVLDLLGVKVDVYVLNTGERIFSAESLERLFGAMEAAR